MPRIVALFNLKPGVSAETYEEWARGTDLPTVNALGSIREFTTHRSAGLLTGGDAPYQYVEIIDVADMAGFAADLATDTMQKVAAQFQEFADNPQFILTEDL
jgi:hypothetical protein